jgi:hypothetical protein
VGERTIEIVEALTHPDGEPYVDYIDRICVGDDWVVCVKLADVEHNWSRLSLLRDEPVRARLAKKYASALSRLRGIHLSGLQARVPPRTPWSEGRGLVRWIPRSRLRTRLGMVG